MMPAFLGRFFLRLLRMEIVDHNHGDWPKKCVVPTGPHTSNWDFPYGVFSRSAVGVYIRFVGKSSLFKFPLGPILRAMGGVPVIRSKRTNFVEGVAKIFKEREAFRLCLAMEGTRSKVSKFKTGFYYIAKEANVPLVFCRFNFAARKIEFSKPFWPTEDIRADFDYIYRHFDGIKGLVAENSFDYNPAVALEGIGERKS